MKMLYQLENNIIKWFKKSRKLIISCLAFGILNYFMLISENLVNSMDGINFTSKYIASWEVTSGRGLLHYLDVIRLGVVSVPFNSILTILIISVTIALIMNLFLIQDKAIRILGSLILISAPIVCDTLTLSYTSVNYAVSFLCSVIAVYSIYYSNIGVGILSGGLFISFTLGTYQAYFSVTCFLLLLLLSKMFLENIDSKNIYIFLLKGIASILVGGLFYYIQTYWLLRKNGYESLSSYRGGSEITLWKIISSLPESIMMCYKEFYNFFVKKRMYLTVSYNKVQLLLVGIAGIALFSILYHFLRLLRKNKVYATCFVISILSIPLAANAVLLIAIGNNITELMIMGLELCVILIAVILPTKGKKCFILQKCYCIIMFLLLWASIITVNNDQLAMKEGKTATVQLVDNIANQLISGGYLNQNCPIALMGKPSENYLFARPSAWETANTYAKFGAFWPQSGLNVRNALTGFLTEYCGMNLSLCGMNKYDELRQSEEVKAMSVFPYEGSIKVVDGVLVVKISEAY